MVAMSPVQFLGVNMDGEVNIVTSMQIVLGDKTGNKIRFAFIVQKPIYVFSQMNYKFPFTCVLNYFPNPVTSILPSKPIL